MVEAKNNLKAHILNELCHSWIAIDKSAGVNATPIKQIPPHIPKIDPKDVIRSFTLIALPILFLYSSHRKI